MDRLACKEGVYLTNNRKGARCACGGVVLTTLLRPVRVKVVTRLVFSFQLQRRP